VRRIDLDRSSREIVVDGRRTRLAEKPFRVLDALMETPGRVVTRDALRRLLWSDDTFVDFDNNLNSAVATLRQVLGDSARSPRFIETLPRVGYRLIVSPAETMAVTARAAARDRPPMARTAPAIAALLIGAVTIGIVAVGRVPPRSADVSRIEAAQVAFARGRFLRGQVTNGLLPVAALDTARQAFRDAAAADPAFAAALAEDADTLVEMAFAGHTGMREALTKARGVAAEARAVDPVNPAAHRVMATADLFLDWDLAGAEARLRYAMRLDPSDARTAIALATALSARGRHASAIAAARRAVALDPESYFARADLAFFYLAAGRAADAARSSREVLEAAPAFAPALRYGALAAERLGRLDDARTLVLRLMTASGASAGDLSRLADLEAGAVLAEWRRGELARAETQAGGRDDAFALTLALRHASLGHTSEALDLLERAAARRDPMFVFVPAFPELAELRGASRFERLVRQVRPY
jgi:DNA-binding winged helix-turn-helix (wHTH) protein/tetratricopeptide (TPR) repeat protein